MWTDWKNITIGVLGIACIILSILAFDKKEVVRVQIPIKVPVEVPIVAHTFDTIDNPVPVYIKGESVIDSTYYDKYLVLKDSIDKDNLFKEVATIREYNEKFEDSIQEVNVYSNITGFLNKQSISYRTKPRTVLLDTVIDTEIKIPFRSKLGAGMEVGILTGKNKPEDSQNLTLKGNLELDTKKIIYKTGYDTDQRVWLGVTLKF